MQTQPSGESSKTYVLPLTIKHATRYWYFAGETQTEALYQSHSLRELYLSSRPRCSWKCYAKYVLEQRPLKSLLTPHRQILGRIPRSKILWRKRIYRWSREIMSDSGATDVWIEGLRMGSQRPTYVYQSFFVVHANIEKPCPVPPQTSTPTPLSLTHTTA